MNNSTGFFFNKMSVRYLTSLAAIGCAAFTWGCCGTIAAETQQPELTAKWIWMPDEGTGYFPAYKGYNQMVQLTKQVRIQDFTEANVMISADSWYRLAINDTWVADGPCRAWPEHYQ